MHNLYEYILGVAQSELEYVKLEDLPDEASVRRLTVRQCRVLLAKHRVTATAIIEKDQLVDRVLTLWRSYMENNISELFPSFGVVTLWVV